MEHDEAHALPDALLHALGDGVIDEVVRRMAPPDEHVGLVQLRLGHAVLGILQGHSGGLDVAVFREQLCDLAVHAVRIVGGNVGVLLLVDVLAPDGNPDRHAGLLRL